MATVPDTDLSAWKTKPEAAALLGVSEKSIERMANTGKIRKAERRIPGRRDLPVYNPDDITQLAGKTIEAVPAGDTAPARKLPPALRKALAPIQRADHFDLLRPQDKTAILTAAAGAEFVPLKDRLWLTVEQAARYSGLSQAAIARLTDGGKLRHVLDGQTRKVRRADLDSLELSGQV